MKIKVQVLFSRFFLACLLCGSVFLYANRVVRAESSDQPTKSMVPAFAISDISILTLDSRNIVIRWTTDVLTDSQVEYGLDELYGSTSDLDVTEVFSHAVQLTNLKPGLIYFYRVISTDGAGNRITSQRFVFVTSVGSPPTYIGSSASATAPALTFIEPIQYDVLGDQTVAFTYQIKGEWPSTDRLPHIFLWADELRNGTWVEQTQSFDVGSHTNSAMRSGSFVRSFAPGTYRISGLLAAYQPKHEVLQGGRVVPLIFTVRDAGSTDVTASSSPLLSSPSGPRFKSGDRIRNWRAADVRQAPSKSNSFIGIQAPDTKGTIMGSSAATNGLRWWNINYDVGYDGWTQEESLLPINAPVFDFELVGLDDHGTSAIQGSSADFSFGGRLTSGTGQLAAFSATGLPADTYGVFSPASCTLPCLTTVRIITLRTARVGMYPITIRAVSAKKEKKLLFKMQITRLSPTPSISLSAPFLEGVVPGPNLMLFSRVTGDANLSGVRSIHFKLNGGQDRADTFLNGSRVFTDLPAGTHIITGYLAGDQGVKIQGTNFSLPFVSDPSLPVVSAVSAQHITEASAAMVWNTDKNSTTRVAYDGVGDLRFSTAEFDTDSRQQTHTVYLHNLLPCARYVYRVYSKNSTGGEGMSVAHRFSTAGCLASPLPQVHAEGIVSKLPGGTLNLVRDDRLVSVTLPPEFPDSAAVQINGIDPAGIESGVPAPTSQSRIVAGHAYRVVVLKNPSASIFESEKPIVVTMRYLPEDVKDIVPGTLKIWRWTGVNWTETHQCHAGNDAHEMSCMTNDLSTFVLFGVSSRLSLAPPPGSLTLVIPPSSALGSKVAGNIPESTPSAIIPIASTASKIKTSSKTPSSSSPLQLSQTDTHTLTQNLYRGIKNSEVKLLQKFLISRNYLAADNNAGFFDGATETAVKKFQCNQEIICQGTPSTTGFGSVEGKTRMRINGLLK